MHMRTCTGATGSPTSAHRSEAASCSTTPARWGGAAFAVRRRRRAFGGAAEVHTVDMEERNQLATLERAVLALEPKMTAYQQRHRAYKFEVAVNVVFHKVVDPTVVTQPPVTLRCEMVAVYADRLP